MDTDERTYSMSEIREKRRAAEQLLALQQRQLAALAKIDEGTAELEQVEREMEALAHGETQPEQPDEAVPPEPQATGEREPQAIGERTLKILQDHQGIWRAGRDVLADMEKRGWVDTDTDHAMQRLRHSLSRLARSNDQVECNKNGMTYLYRYVPRVDSDLLVPVPHPNGVAYPALQGGPSDGLDEQVPRPVT
jgi:hypothetical protein